MQVRGGAAEGGGEEEQCEVFKGGLREATEEKMSPALCHTKSHLSLRRPTTSTQSSGGSTSLANKVRPRRTSRSDPPRLPLAFARRQTSTFLSHSQTVLQFQHQPPSHSDLKKKNATQCLVNTLLPAKKKRANKSPPHNKHLIRAASLLVLLLFLVSINLPFFLAS